MIWVYSCVPISLLFFIITVITLPVLLRIYEDANNLLSCYDSACCFILKSILLLFGSVIRSGDKHLKPAKLERSSRYPGGAYKTRQLLLKYLLLQLALHLLLLLPICGPQGLSDTDQGLPKPGR